MTQSSDNAPALHPLLRDRWSPRAFQDRPVEPEKLRSILEAARWAPSALNEQPWRFLLGVKAEDPEAFRRIFEILAPGNQLWAGQAPVLVLSVAKMRNSKDQPNPYAFHDVGQAVAHLTVQATALGLSVHQMAGFDAARAREELSIPDGYDPVAAIAVGYQGDPDSLPENLRAREVAARVRRPPVGDRIRRTMGQGGRSRRAGELNKLAQVTLKTYLSGMTIRSPPSMT